MSSLINTPDDLIAGFHFVTLRGFGNEPFIVMLHEEGDRFLIGQLKGEAFAVAEYSDDFEIWDTTFKQEITYPYKVCRDYDIMSVSTLSDNLELEVGESIVWERSNKLGQ